MAGTIIFDPAANEPMTDVSIYASTVGMIPLRSSTTKTT